MFKKRSTKPVVIIKFGALGDVVRTSYFVEPLAAKHAADIVWITSSGSKDLLRFNYHVTNVVCPPLDKIPNEASVVISLDDEYEAARIASSIRCDTLIGSFIDEGGQIKYSENASLWFDMGLISKHGKERADKFKQLNRMSHAEIFGSILGISRIRPAFYGNPLIEQVWKTRRGLNRVIIGLNPFAGRRWPSKEMPSIELATLIQNICDHLESETAGAFKIWVFVDNDTAEKANMLNANFDKVEIWNTGSGIHQFAAAISVCNYVISTDSLGLHLAIAQNVPNLSFFAPTSADEIDTFGNGVKVKSTSSDYCNYNPYADNSTLTAKVVFDRWVTHFCSVVDARV